MQQLIMFWLATTILFGCRTLSPEQTSPQPYADSLADEVLFEKILGGHAEDGEDPKAPLLSCQVKSKDLAEPKLAKTWIAELEEAETGKLYHITFIPPSKRILAYSKDHEQPFIVFYNGSYGLFKKASDGEGIHPAATSIIELVDKHCPDPSSSQAAK